MIRMTTRAQADLAWEVRRREVHQRWWPAAVAVAAAVAGAVTAWLIRGRT